MTTTFNVSDVVRTEAGEMVTVVEIRTRGWVSIKTAAGALRNVQAKTLTSIEQEIEEMVEEPVAEEVSFLSTLVKLNTTPAPVAAEEKSVFDWHHCPKCGSDDIYNGRNVDGEIKKEGPNGVWGCCSCGWEEDFSSSRKNGIIPADYLDGYQRVTIVRRGEKVHTIDNGDAVARALRNCQDLDEVYEYVADTTGRDEDDLRTRYAHLNVGQQRMNLGNVLRGYLKKAAKAAEAAEAAKAA